MATISAAHRLAAVLDAAMDALIEVGPDCTIVSWNAAATGLFGYAAGELAGTSVGRLFDRGAADAVTYVTDVAGGTRSSAAFRATARHRDGTRIDVSVAVAPIRGSRGAVAGAAVALRDARAPGRAEVLLAIREARYRALVARMSEIAVVFTDDGVLTYVSPRATAPGDPELTALVGRQVFDFVHERDRGFARAVVATFARVPGTYPPIVLRGVSPAGETRWWRVLVTNLRDDPAVRGLTAVVQDFTHQKAIEDELARYRDHDLVTGLPTRSALAHALAQPGSAPPVDVALAVIEVDGLEGVQRKAGAFAADSVRRAVAGRLREAVAHDDVLVRLSGNAFAVARRSVRDPRAARAFADGLLGAVREPFVVAGSEWSLTASAGFTVGDGSDPDTLVRDADAARLQAAATKSGHAHAHAAAIGRAAHDRVALIRTFGVGLPEDRLDLELQPVIRLADGIAVGNEALLRWREADGRLLPPPVVLAAAAASGVLPQLGEWILNAACARVAASHATRDAFVSVNVSARELVADGFLERVRDALDRAALLPRRLIIEVSETAAFRGAGGHVGVVERVAELGVRIALDQFGTDRGSFAHLKRLPITMVKIAREFVADLGTDDDDDAIVSSLLNLAAAVGVDAVAVGVETDPQRVALTRMGCLAAQGFLFGGAGLPDTASADPMVDLRRRGSRAGPAAVDPLVVARIRSLLAQGASLDTIAAALNRENLAHPHERRWHPRAVAQVIASAQELSTRDQWRFL